MRDLRKFIKYLSEITEEIVFDFFPAIELGKDIEENQIIFSNGLSYIYLEHVDNIFHLSAFDQMNQEQKFCIEINTENEIVNEKETESRFKEKLIEYFESICVGILRLNYKNIHKKIKNLVVSKNSEYKETVYYDFLVEDLRIKWNLNDNYYYLIMAAETTHSLEGTISWGIDKMPEGFHIPVTNIDINKIHIKDKNKSQKIVDDLLNEIIIFFENEI